ncbi:hypothetical protein [Endozoicomonas sp.]|uniref:hypothetical protein n=1 Tax=Endozoicomonas sp. TaxID=1892382 RepID=UPI00383B24D6
MALVRGLAEYLITEFFTGRPIHNIASTAAVRINSENTDSASTAVNTNPKNPDRWVSWQERHYTFFLGSYRQKTTLEPIVSKIHDFLNQDKNSKAFEYIKSIANCQLGIANIEHINKCDNFLDIANRYKLDMVPLTRLINVCITRGIFQDDLISEILNEVEEG